jgi:hypothetical protein
MLSVDEVRDAFEYDSESGMVFFKGTKNEAGKVKANRRTSYRYLSLKGKTLLAHRVAWALCNGEWPSGQIDHIDGDGLNNAIDNLRDVSHAENQRNQRLHIKNKSGFRGVHQEKRSGKWVAMIWVGKKRKHIGTFSSAALAAEARRAAEIEYWGK